MAEPVSAALQPSACWYGGAPAAHAAIINSPEINLSLQRLAAKQDETLNHARSTHLFASNQHGELARLDHQHEQARQNFVQASMVTQQGGLQQLDEELCQARRKLEAKLPPKHPASGQGAPVGSSIVISDFLDPRVIKRCLGAAWDLCDSHKERSAVLAKWCLDQRLWQERANANKKPKENPKKNPVQAELTDPDFILALPIDDLKELLRPLVTFLKGWKLRKKEKGDPRANGKATRLNTYRTMVEPAREAHFSAISKWRMVIFKEEDDAPPFPVSLDGKLFMDAAVLNSVDIKEMAAFLDDVEASKEFSIDKLPFVSPSGLGSQDPPLQVQLSGGSAAQRPDQSDCYCQTTLSKAFCSCSTAVKLGHMPMLQSREFFKSAADSTASTSQEPAASPETVQIGECIDELLAIKHDLAAEPPNKRAKPSDDLDSIQPANLMTQATGEAGCPTTIPLPLFSNIFG